MNQNSLTGTPVNKIYPIEDNVRSPLSPSNSVFSEDLTPSSNNKKQKPNNLIELKLLGNTEVINIEPEDSEILGLILPTQKQKTNEKKSFPNDKPLKPFKQTARDLLLNLIFFAKGVRSETANKLTEQFMTRVRIRYCFLFIFTAILILICCGFYFGTAYEGDLIYEIKNPLNINMDLKNCLVSIHDFDSKSNIKIHYKYNMKIDPYINSEIEQTYAKFEKLNSDINIKIFSELTNLYYCKVDIYVEKSIILNKLQLNSEAYSKCIIVQDSSQFSASLLTIQNGNIFSNFRNVVADTFYYKTSKGNLQLNKFKFRIATIDINYGDIFLQSSNDLILNWKNEQQTFCFSAPYISHQNIQDCYIAEKSKKKNNFIFC